MHFQAFTVVPYSNIGPNDRDGCILLDPEGTFEFLVNQSNSLVHVGLTKHVCVCLALRVHIRLNNTNNRRRKKKI